MHDMDTIAPLRERTFTVSEYYRLARHGILTGNDRVELLDGRIYEMAPIGSRHAHCVRRLTELLVLRVTPAALVSVQNPVRLNYRSEPEPDVALLEPKDDYADRHPGPDDVLLLIEVADSSLDFDRNVKPLLYARAGIPELWVIALSEERVHVYRRAGTKGYAEHAVTERGGDIDIAALPDAGPIAVDALFG